MPQAVSRRFAGMCHHSLLKIRRFELRARAFVNDDVLQDIARLAYQSYLLAKLERMLELPDSKAPQLLAKLKELLRFSEEILSSATLHYDTRTIHVHVNSNTTGTWTSPSLRDQIFAGYVLHEAAHLRLGLSAQLANSKKGKGITSANALFKNALDLGCYLAAYVLGESCASSAQFDCRRAFLKARCWGH